MVTDNKKRRAEDHAVSLAEMNARNTTIAALTGLSLSEIKKTLSIIHGRVPPKGRAGSLETYINNKKHRRHASFIVCAYNRSSGFGLNHVESLIQAYNLYQTSIMDRFSDDRSFIDIDHAYFLVHETNKNTDYQLFDCPTCRAEYFSYKFELPLICPFCTDKAKTNINITKKSKIA